jgi:hypothetical protein
LPDSVKTAQLAEAEFIHQAVQDKITRHTDRPWLLAGGLACLAALLVLDLMQLHGVMQAQGLRDQDFFGLWSFAQFIRTHPALELYQPLVLNPYQHTLDPAFKRFYPFPYPPDFLVPLWPLGWLPYWPARLLWTGLSAGLFAWTVWRALAGTQIWRGWGVALVLIAPASLDCFMTGETGFFTSALLLGGFLLLPKRPLLAGLCFGLLMLKPQLCVLLPFALAGCRAWRTVVAAVLTALALAVLSCLLLPPGMWPAWWVALERYQALVGQNSGQLAPLMTTLTATAQSFGFVGKMSWFVELAGLAVAGLLCFALFRRGVYPLAVAALLAGTFAFTPHAFFYDAPVVVYALLRLPWRGGYLWLDILLATLLPLPLFAGTSLLTYNLAGLLCLASSCGWLGSRSIGAGGGQFEE